MFSLYINIHNYVPQTGENMATVETKDLEVGTHVRYPSATVWRVADKKPAEKDSQGNKWKITLTHARHTREVTVWDWFKWIEANACEHACKLTGEHTGR
jgi:hypothetical protein